MFDCDIFHNFILRVRWPTKKVNGIRWTLFIDSFRYHVGYFRQLNREPNNNQPANVVPAANNNENAAPAPVVEQQPQPQQPAADAANNEENPNNEAEPLVNAASPTDNDGADNVSNRTPTIVLVRTFIMSFFASLIPETPAL